MTTSAVALSAQRLELDSIAEKALKMATRLWIVVVVIGQLMFSFEVASFYGMAVVHGTTPQAWSNHITHGYVPGDGMGNFAVSMHLLSAVIIILAGMIQLVPQIRERAPAFHRWNGRLYVIAAFTVSLAGLYMTWVRGSVGDLSQHLGQSLNGLLIMICAAMALRYAVARDFTTHRRWALRLYLVVSASLFIRAGIFLSLFLNHGPFGFDPATFSGPFLTFITFAQYMVPLTILELYFLAKERGKALGRLAMASGLVVAAVALGAGLFAVTVGVWMPALKKAYDSRKSIAAVMSASIASNGVNEAASQYHKLKAARAGNYNFDEDELDTLGYELIKTKKYTEAIRIFQLNVEAYPQSFNTYDSLGEAYMDNGDRALAIANYKRSLELNPKNHNARKMLKKIGAP
jgi:uncharacterized membrane protein